MPLIKQEVNKFIDPFKSFLVKLDNTLDKTPLSPINNTINIIVKGSLALIKSFHGKVYQGLNGRYMTHLKNKSLKRCFILTIPIFGWIVIALYDCVKSKSTTFKGNANMADNKKPTSEEKKTAPLDRPEIAEKSFSNICLMEQLHSYTGDLNSLQKSQLQMQLVDENVLQINFLEQKPFRLEVRIQDLFESGAQVIVNAANTHLGGGGGIDGAIHTRGKESYQAAHRQLKLYYASNYSCGFAALIESGALKEVLKIDHVIVEAGPQGEATEEKESQLYSCYYNSLLLAHQNKQSHLAFPSISTGIFGFSKERAAAISLKACFDFINSCPVTSLQLVSIHSQTKEALPYYQQACS